MSEHVVAHDQRALLSLRAEPAGGLETEELDACGDSGLLCDSRDVGGGLDAEDRDSLRPEVLEKVAVVARDLDDLVAAVEVETADHLLRVGARVAQPAVGVGREVRVIIKDFCRRHHRRQLDEEAVLADVHA